MPRILEIMEEHGRSGITLRPAKQIFIFLICILNAPCFLGTLIHPEDARYTGTGTVEKYEEFYYHGTGCYYTLQENGQFQDFNSYNDEAFMCGFVERAHQAHNVSIRYNATIKPSFHTERGLRYYSVTLEFPNRGARWTNGKELLVNYKYVLVGSVENVLYDSSEKCFVAIRGDEVKHNLEYHSTIDIYLCRLALDAYYKKLTVKMVCAYTVDSPSNEIISLDVIENAKCT